jgi:hypothetical protein
MRAPGIAATADALPRAPMPAARRRRITASRAPTSSAMRRATPDRRRPPRGWHPERADRVVGPTGGRLRNPRPAERTPGRRR